MQWKPFGPVATAVLAVLAGLWLQFHHNQDLAAARAETEYAVAVAKVALAYGDSMSSIAAEASAAAAEQAYQADAAERARKAAAPARAKIVAAAPDTCRPAIAALTAERDEAVAEAAGWHQAYQEQLRATAALQSAQDSLRPATEHLANAATTLVKKSGESFWHRITPQFGIGGTVGIDPTTGKLAKAIGPTLTWHF